MADVRLGHEAARFNPLDFPQCWDLPKRASASAWHEHTPFMKVLVQLLRPKILVQSGIENGDFYLSICEAAASLGIACYGVDTAKPDSNGSHDDKVLNELRAIHDPLYSTFSHLLPGPFEDAAAHFAENSIELLHIDGLQSYEAVCHDWETWRPKISRSGVVVFQGTDARNGPFGMWRLWKQLKFTYQHFEFLHGQGLGVLVTGPGIPEALNVFLSMAEKNPEPVRKYFFALGSRASLRAHIDVTRQEVKTLEARIVESEALCRARAEELEKRDHALADKAAEIARIQALADARDQALRSHDAEAQTLHAQIEALRVEAAEGIKLRATIDAHERSLQARDAESKALSEQLEKLRVEAAEGVKLKATIDAHERSLLSRDAESKALNEQLEKLRAEAAKVPDLLVSNHTLERALRASETDMKALNEQLQKARAEAAEVETLNAMLEEQEQSLRAREAEARAQNEQLEKLRAAAADTAGLAAKFEEQERQLRSRDSDEQARQALTAQLQKLQADATEIGRLNAKIEELEQTAHARESVTLSLKEQLAKLQFEAADQRNEEARLRSSASYRLAQWLAAPFRFLKTRAPSARAEIKGPARK